MMLRLSETTSAGLAAVSGGGVGAAGGGGGAPLFGSCGVSSMVQSPFLRAEIKNQTVRTFYPMRRSQRAKPICGDDLRGSARARVVAGLHLEGSCANFFLRVARSSRGLGRWPLTPVTRVRIPYGLPCFLSFEAVRSCVRQVLQKGMKLLVVESVEAVGRSEAAFHKSTDCITPLRRVSSAPPFCVP